MTLTAVIVDDDSVIRKSLDKFLADLGFDVLSAADGNSGMKYIEELKPDLVISDMLIPGIHGIDICRKIKNNPELAGTTVILMSSLYKRSDTIQSELQSNYDGFLEKPFGFEELVGVLRSAGVPL